MEELAEFIKEKSESQALVHVSQGGESAPFDSPSALAKMREVAAEETAAKPVQDEELMQLLQRIKDSIGHTGGTVGETKNILRDLRGEVLGMGRELGRKLDQVSEAQLNNTLDRSIEDSQGNQTHEEIQRVIEEGIGELKAHINGMLQQRAEQDDESFKQLATTRAGPSSEEMYGMVQHALSEHHAATKPETEGTGLDRESVLDAVKDGLKDFEPNIELQQFGLERDEILTVLREGLEEYQSNRPEPAAPGIDKGEVFEVMQEALKDFHPGATSEHLQAVKDEIIVDVRQAIEDFKASPSAPALDDAMVKEAVLVAVKEGLAEQAPAMAREFEISKDDLFEAVKASIDGTTIPFNSFGEQVLQQLHELVGGMREEFKEYSAANGRDTEQVLDAVKDGLESLRAEIESYVDRAQDVTGKDEIVDTVKGGLEQLRADVQGYVAEGPANDSGKAEMLEYIKAEFEHLHEAVTSSRDADEAKPDHTAAIILAIKEGMEELKGQVGTSRGVGEDGGEDSREEMYEAMKEEFEQLKASLLNAHAIDKGELQETIQDSMGALHAKLEGSDVGNRSIGEQEELIAALREDIAQLKEAIAPASASIGPEDKEAIVEGVRQTIEELRTSLAGDQSDASAEALGAIKEELEKFKESMGSSMVLAGAATGTSDDHEMLVALREGLEEIKEQTSKQAAAGAVPEELLEAMRGEFENLRNSIATSVVQGGSNEEVLDAVRLGLDDLRGDFEKKLDSPERTQQQTSEMLDAINEGLETLRTDVTKTLDKPLDMTVNYEILDTLKDGLAALRADIDTLKAAKEEAKPAEGNEIVLAEAGEGGETRELSPEDVAAAEAASGAPAGAADSVNREDLDKIEVLLTQLQIKIEAMDATVQDTAAAAHEAAGKPAGPAEPAEGTAMKVDLEQIEVSLQQMQETVNFLASREPPAMPEIPAPPAPEGIAMKDDTDALETLLRNTKAQIEELQISMPDPATGVTKEHLDAVEGVIAVTKEAVDGLAEKIETSTAGKADVAVVEVLAQDVKTMLEEVKEKMSAEPSEEEQAQRVNKADFDVLGVICTEIKAKVEEMQLPNPEELPSKADVEQLQGLISDFRESHDKMKESYENDIGITAKAFDDRRQEFDDTVKHIEEVKASLLEIKDELVGKLTEGETGVTSLGETLKTLEEKTSNEALTTDVKEILDTVKAEFEKAHGMLEAMKVDNDANAALSLEKQGEHKDNTVSELTARLDTIFDSMMSKFDDAQTAAEEKAKSLEEKTAAQDELFNNTKAMADDLKLSIDTLGTSLTTFMTTYPEAMDKVTEDSKTVFAKMEETCGKVDETHGFQMAEHGATREEVVKVMAAIDAVQSDLTEHNPRFMVSLKEVQALINQHYEHSQQASASADEHAASIKELQEQIKAGLEEAKNHHTERHEELKRDLPGLFPAPQQVEMPAFPEIPAPEKYDDSAVHEKLDTLMGHAAQAADPSAQIQKLDEIHEKVMATAAEVSAFVAMQAKQITADHESKEKEAEEVALLLERRMVQKDQIEAEITVMNEEKDSLRTAVEALRAEREALASQKSKMQADVSGLETALQIRREELHAMDSKAEAIERRMLEGVMNQSRMFLLAKAARTPTAAPPSPKKRSKPPSGRDLRVPSDASVMTSKTGTSTVPGLKEAMTRSRPVIQRNGGQQLANSGERRIMSLSQISGNARSAAPINYRSNAPSLISSNGGLSRSHSVKSNFMRGKRGQSLGGFDKENEGTVDTLSEESEGELDEHERPESSQGTERRGSVLTGSHYEGDEDGRSYAEGPTPLTEDGAPPSEYTYGTGSYLTGSEVDGERRDSLESSRDGTIGVPSTLEEGPEEESVAPEGDEAMSELEPPPAIGDKAVYAPPSDSGLGTDLPTAALSVSDGASYFPGDDS